MILREGLGQNLARDVRPSRWSRAECYSCFIRPTRLMVCTLAILAIGGVDFLVWRGLALGVDVRYQHVFEDTRFGVGNLTRAGSLVSCRF